MSASVDDGISGGETTAEVGLCEGSHTMCCVMDARIRLVRCADMERRGGESRLIAVSARDFIGGGCEAGVRQVIWRL